MVVLAVRTTNTVTKYHHMPLTDLAIRQAKPKSKPYKLADGKGLHLLVNTAGKYWRFKYRFLSKQKTLALGVYPEVSLTSAREKRDEARKVMGNGGDPGQVKKAQKQQAKLRAENAFEPIAREWIEQQCGRWTPDHTERVLRSLERGVFPDLGPRPVAEINPPELLAVLRQIERRGALEMAGRTLQRCRAVFRYAIQTGRAERNPATDLVGVLKTRKVEHRLALGRAELPEFLAKLKTYDGHPLTRLALRFMVMTFVRTGELRRARWEEFDIEGALWRIPAERMKMRAAHLVPLTPQALEVLEELRPYSGRYALVFPSQNDHEKPMSENTLLYAFYRMGYHRKATVHGIRATASTILNEAGFASDVVERQLAHAERNKVRAAYHRAEYLDERRRMMQWWGDYLDALASGTNVIPIRQTR